MHYLALAAPSPWILDFSLLTELVVVTLQQRALARSKDKAAGVSVRLKPMSRKFGQPRFEFLAQLLSLHLGALRVFQEECAASPAPWHDQINLNSMTCYGLGWKILK
jgi:hypothetical protein